MDDWADEPKRGMTRRRWIRSVVGVSAVGAVVGLGVSAGSLLPPPVRPKGDVRDTFSVSKFSSAQWWDPYAGRPANVDMFENVWDGLTAVWRGVFDQDTGELLLNTGMPAIIIRVPKGDSTVEEPSAFEERDGFSLRVEHPVEDSYVVAFFDRCVHLCCQPGWHVITTSVVAHSDYVEPSKTYEKYGEDPIYCICHGSQFDPLDLRNALNPKTEARYVGARRVHLPADRPLPSIPLKLEGTTLIGGYLDPAWYVYC